MRQLQSDLQARSYDLESSGMVGHGVFLFFLVFTAFYRHLLIFFNLEA